MTRICWILTENRSTVSDTEELTLIPDPQFRRKKTAVDLDVALKLYNFSEYEQGFLVLIDLFEKSR